MPTHYRCAVVCLALTAGLVAPAHSQEKSLKIGWLGTMSGPNAQLGIDGLDGLRLAIETKGGKLGGRSVEVIVADDQQRPEQATLEAKRLAERDRIEIVIGTTFSNTMLAALKPLTDAGAFVISPNAGPSPLAGTRCHPNFFAVSYQNDEIYAPIGKYMSDKGFKRVFVLAPSYQAGKDAVAGFKKTYTGDVINEIYTPIAQLDYLSEITQIAAVKPEAVFVFYPGGLAVNFVKQYAQSGLKGAVPLYSGFALVDEGVRGAQGADSVGILTSGNWSPDLPASQDFVKRFEAAYKRTPSEYAMFAYDAGLLVDSAIAAVGGDLKDRDKFRAELKAAKFLSARGSFRFNSNHFPIQNWFLREVVASEGGKTMLKLRSTIFTDKPDDFATSCPMKN